MLESEAQNKINKISGIGFSGAEIVSSRISLNLYKGFKLLYYKDETNCLVLIEYWIKHRYAIFIG